MIAVRKYKQFITFYKYIITSISYGISYVDSECDIFGLETGFETKMSKSRV